MNSIIYTETFDDSPGGWIGWASNALGPAGLEHRDGTVATRSPWWIDYNHAPPGGGYLHVLFALQTRRHFKLDESMQRLGGVNRFVEGDFQTDFTNAKVTIRVRGETNLQGAQLLFHAQAKINGKFINQTLIGQPFHVTREWSEQTIHLVPDPSQWKCLGARHDRGDFYGDGPIDEVLRDVNGNIILILYPLNVVTEEAAITNPHTLRAGEDYPVDASRLPSGYIMLDEVRIEFADQTQSVAGLPAI